MPSPPCSILSVGYDDLLLLTRRLVLERAGFVVWDLPDLFCCEQALQVKAFDLILLCHTIGLEQSLRAMELVQRYAPETPVLALVDTNIDSPPLPSLHTLRTRAPARLTAIARRLVHPRLHLPASAEREIRDVTA